MGFDDFDEFSSFLPDVVPLNWETSNFEMTVLEGFYDLSKFLETSISSLDKLCVHRISGPSVIGAQRNRLSKKGPEFLPRSTQRIFKKIVLEIADDSLLRKDLM